MRLMAWSALEEWTRKKNALEPVLRMGLLHGPCLGFFLFFYLSFIRHILLGGGPIYDKKIIALRSAALAVGASARGPWALAGAILVLLIVFYGVILLYRAKDRRWLGPAARKTQCD